MHEVFPQSPPTQKQLDFIAIIEEAAGIKFTGATKREAYAFIQGHKHVLEEYNDWAIIGGY